MAALHSVTSFFRQWFCNSSVLRLVRGCQLKSNPKPLLKCFEIQVLVDYDNWVLFHTQGFHMENTTVLCKKILQ